MKSSNDKNEKWIPDIINLYSDGEEKKLTKIENPLLFDRISSLIIFEKADMMSGGNPPVLVEDINEMKKVPLSMSIVIPYQF